MPNRNAARQSYYDRNLRTPLKVYPPASEGPTVAPDVEFLAHWLDDVFVIPGTRIRFGLDGLLGLVPGLGDTLTALASFYILAAGRRYGVSRATLLRMAGNIGLDYLAGMMPLLGDMFDIAWKANRRNVVILEQHLAATPHQRRQAARGDGLFVAALVAGLVLLLIGSVTVAWWIVFSLGHLLAQAGA